MANDLSNPVNATVAANRSGDGFFDHGAGSDSLFGAVQLAQAEGGAAPAQGQVPGQTIHVTAPQEAAGPVVIRVEVAPGSIVELPQPFEADAALAAKEGDGNLAIRVGDVTVILQGYIQADNDPQHPVTIEGADGKPIDIATILASTDPAIDIQTAAGPADSQGGQGADNTGAILAQLEGGNGLSGFEGAGAQDQTELGYSLIDGSLRQEFATTLAATEPFGFTVGNTLGSMGEAFLRDPAQTDYISDFATFMQEYQDVVENPSNPMFPGWADFQGTNATGGNFAEYLSKTRQTIDVDVHFTGAIGDLVLNGLAPGVTVTSNGAELRVEHADQGHTLFVRRNDDEGALVAVVHVEGPDASGHFTIETIMVNRLDHGPGDTGDAGKDSMSLEIDFTVYDGPAPNPEQQEEGGPTSPSIDGSFTASFVDDVPILEDVKYHNQHEIAVKGPAALVEGAGNDHCGSDIGLIDEDWLRSGAHDKDENGNSNAGDTGDDDHGDTGGGTCVTGCIKVNFGADGPALADNKAVELANKHAFELNTGYKLGEIFLYQGSPLTSGHEKLKVLSISGDHITVGIPDSNPQQQLQALEGAEANDQTPSEQTDPIPGCTIFELTLNQDTGTFEFDLKGPLDHNPAASQPTDSIFGDESGVSALAEDETPQTGTEETIDLHFDVRAYDDDGDYVDANINIDVNDDVPVARDDHDHVEKGSFAEICGNVITAWNEDSSAGRDAKGGDGAVVFGVAAGSLTGAQSVGVGDEIHGTYGTLTMGADGKYSYTRNPGTPGGGDDHFTYTLKDGDGDTSTAVLTVHIDNACVTITLPDCPADTTVYESGLPARSGEAEGTDAAANSETTSGQITIKAPDTIDTLVIGSTTLHLSALNALTPGVPAIIQDGTRGELLLTHFDASSGKLDYTYNLFDNDLVSGDSTTASFAITVKDLDGSEGDATLKIKIVDDAPEANCDEISAVAGRNADVQFILDVSGSLKDAFFNVPGSTYPDNGIGLERYAAEQMLTAHPEIQNVQIVLFDEHATHSVWMTAADAIAYLQDSNNFKSSGGNTNYDQALDEAMDGYGEPRPLPQSDQTLVYFFSDGNPNQPGGQNTGINGVGNGSNVSTGEWEEFVSDNDISNVYVVGIGNINSTEFAQLTPISYPNTDAQAPAGEDNVLNITSGNVSTLVNSLGQNIVSVTQITGNVTTNDVPGADDYGTPKLVGATYEGNTFTLGAEHDLGAGRGKLTLNADGSYTYTPPAGHGDGTPFYVEYTIQDGDGDQSTAKLKIDLTVAPEVDLDANCDGNNASASFVEDQPSPTLIAPAGIVTADATIGSMTVTLTNRPDGDATERLAIGSLPSGLSATYANGVLTITGSASAAVYQDVLRHIEYQNDSQNPNGADRSVTVSVKDEESTPLTSITHIVTVSVTAVNDAPTADIAPASFHVDEQSYIDLSGKIGSTFNMVVGDVDAANDKVTVTLTVTEGRLFVDEGNSGADVISGDGTSTVVIKGTIAQINNLLKETDTGPGSAGSIKYYDDTDTPSAQVTLKLEVNDNGENGTGGAKTAFDTATIIVNDVNDKPVTDLNGGGSGSDISRSFIEQTALLVAPAGIIADDSGKLKSMTVTLTNRPDGDSAESLSLNSTAEAARSDNGLSFSYNTATGVATITGPLVSALVYQTILQGIQYNNSSDTPNTIMHRTVTVVVSDGSLSSDSHSIDISVTAVNDAPTADIAPVSFTVNEQTDLSLSGKIGAQFNMLIGDVDSGNDTVTVTLSVGKGTLTVDEGNSGADVSSGNGSSTVVIKGSVTEINNLFKEVDTGSGSAGSIKYYYDSDTPNPSTTLTLKVDDNGENGFGGAKTASDTATIFIADTPEPPIACDDNVVTNAGSNLFNIPEWALTYNDSDVDTSNSSLDLISGPGAVLNSNGGTAGHPTDGVGNAGTVTFTDSGGNGGAFDYKVTDGTSTDTGHVTVTQDTNGTLTGSSNDDIVVVYGSSGKTVNANGGDDIVIGGGGKDTLDGGSGNDLIFGQGGDDTMVFGNGDKYDGGADFDRVRVDGSGVTVTYDASKFLNVEMIDIGDANDRSGNSHQNTLALNASDLGVHNYGKIGGFEISLYVIGDTDGNGGNNANNRDNVDLTGFHQEAGVSGSLTDAATGDPHTFNVWTSNANAAIHVAVEQNLDVV